MCQILNMTFIIMGLCVDSFELSNGKSLQYKSIFNLFNVRWDSSGLISEKNIEIIILFFKSIDRTKKKFKRKKSTFSPVKNYPSN